MQCANDSLFLLSTVWKPYGKILQSCMHKNMQINFVSN
jgi:hypothetical protein